MLTGIQLRAYPTNHQKLILSQWMGCARFIWNAKCDEVDILPDLKDGDSYC
ncbi:helix-turn-helix domain-containing protein [Acinetobacter towneri]|uniref:helix-turn-helix domain-containing protein n=1 Tax=Acinetobacter towneri TaxID=202956 RepID=UPI00257820AF|nr:helix-turn-helix domain-containing protein [Acinetobacter towneri]